MTREWHDLWTAIWAPSSQAKQRAVFVFTAGVLLLCGVYAMTAKAMLPSGAGSQSHEPAASVRSQTLAADDPAAPPATQGDRTIYVGSSEGMMYAVGSDGVQKWSVEAGPRNYPPAVGADGTVYVGGNYETVRAINPDGSVKWQLKTDGLLGRSSPAIGKDGTIYVGGGRLHAIWSDGTEKWARAIGPARGTSGDLSPAVGTDGTIYVCGCDGCLYAITPDGALKWKFSPSSLRATALHTAPVVGRGGTIFISGTDGARYAINPQGQKKWDLGGEGVKPVCSAPQGGCVTVYVGGSAGNRYAVWACRGRINGL